MMSTLKVQTRHFTAFDVAGTAHAVTEYTHYVAAEGAAEAPRAAFKSYALDSGECVNAWPDDSTLICMRSGAVLHRSQPPADAAAPDADLVPMLQASPALRRGAANPLHPCLSAT